MKQQVSLANYKKGVYKKKHKTLYKMFYQLC